MENQENLINDLLQLFNQIKLDDKKVPDDFIKFAGKKIKTIKQTVYKFIDKSTKFKDQINQLSNEELLDELINLDRMSIKLESDKNELLKLENQFRKLVQNSKSNNKSINYLTEIKYEFENPYQKSFDQALLELNLDQQSFDYSKNDFFRLDNKLNQFTNYSKLSFNLIETNYSVYTLNTHDNHKGDKSFNQEIDLIKSLIQSNLIKQDELIRNVVRGDDSENEDSDCSDNSNDSNSDDSSNDHSENSPIVLDKRFKIDEHGNLNEIILNSSSDSSDDNDTSNDNLNYTSDDNDASNDNLTYNYSDNFLKIYDTTTDETSSDEEIINTAALGNLMRMSLLQDHLSSSDNSDKE